jgi:3'-phosphoadenosine 5'-phosphosulfate sulfotransferase (PAPS reductase)/FAD synthetase
MTNSELIERQKWPMARKVIHSIEVIETFIDRTGKMPYVSFSGGKDSTVLLDIARRFVDRTIRAVFCNTGNEYPEVIRFVRETENVTVIRPRIHIGEIVEKYGFPLISKDQASSIYQAKTTRSEKLRLKRLNGNPETGQTLGKISECWKYLVNEKFMVSDRCCYHLKKYPFEVYRRRTGRFPLIGIMAAEGKLRKMQYLQRGGCSSFKENDAKSYPLSIWTDRDIWEYIHKFGIPCCSLYASGHSRTGCMFCGFGVHLEKTSRFRLLYEQHPKLYAVFMDYQNSGVTYREALRTIHISLPDED